MTTMRRLGALAVLVLASGPLTAQADPVYETSFESPTFTAGNALNGQDGWTAEFSPSAALISTQNPASGLQDVRVAYSALEDNRDFGVFIGTYRRDLPIDAIASGRPIVTVQAAVRLDGPSTNSGGGTADDRVSANLIVYSETEELLGLMLLSSNNNVYVFATGLPDYSFATPVTLGAYHTLAQRFDFQAGTISYLVDGVVIGTNVIPTAAGRGLGFALLDTEALDDGSVNPANYTAYFDDFQATAVPEPASLVVTAMGMFGLSVVFRKRFGRRSS